MVDAVLVPRSEETVISQPTLHSSCRGQLTTHAQTARYTPVSKENATNGCKGNITTDLIIHAARRESTHNKYNCYIKLWDTFSAQFDSITVDHILSFLSDMFEKGASYSAINSAKCAIATKVHIPPYPTANKHPVIMTYIKGVFNLRPPVPKLTFVWDVNIIFTYFEKQGNNDKLSDMMLSQKLLMLLLLLGAQRLNTIKHFCIDRMIVNNISIAFSPDKVLKHSRQGRKLDTFEYRSYPKNPKICVIECIKEYLTRRSKYVNADIKELIITTRKPFRPASLDTMRRWVKAIFTTTNIHNFTPHSCRAAATSKAKSINVDIDEILKRGCWKNRQNFFKFYDKEIRDCAKNDIDFNQICEN